MQKNVRSTTVPLIGFQNPAGEECGKTRGRIDVQFFNQEQRAGDLTRLIAKAHVYYGEEDRVTTEEFLDRVHGLDAQLAKNLAGKFDTEQRGTVDIGYFERGQLEDPYRCYILKDYAPKSITRPVEQPLYLFRDWLDKAIQDRKLAPNNPENGRIFRQGVNPEKSGRKLPTEIVAGIPFPYQFCRGRPFMFHDKKNDLYTIHRQGIIVLLPGAFDERDSFVRKMQDGIDATERWVRELWKDTGIQILSMSSGSDVDFESIKDLPDLPEEQAPVEVTDDDLAVTGAPRPAEA